jgi:tRNA pseudouridine38-40 synthase
MKRYFFEISYKGTKYFGWQRQPNQISIQEVIEETIGKLHSTTMYPLVGCGRTDTGVHAHHYVFHIDLPEIASIENMIFKLNRMLPGSIVIHSIKEVNNNFHSRFSATKRTYRYFIHTQKNAFITESSTYVAAPFDIEKMNQAAKLLIGTHDFTSLSKLHTDVKTNICSVHSAEWFTIENGVYFEISADRFLRNMVRATVGTLLDVGFGKIQPEDLPGILDAKDRQAASISVPAEGLFLWKVEY